MLLINYEKEININELYQIFYDNTQTYVTKEKEETTLFFDRLNAHLIDKTTYFLIAREDNIAVGYLIFRLDNETLHIEDMQITENYHGKRMLFRDFLFFAKTKTSTKIKFISAYIPNYYTKAQKIAQHLKMEKVEILFNGIMFVGKIKKIC